MTVAAMMSGGMQQPVLADYTDLQNPDVLQNQTDQLTKENGITVTTSEQFMEALKQQQSPITVEGVLSISNGAEEDGRMKPVMIPENTVIQGTEGSSLNSRGPIQLEGDGVCFRNIELTFSSSSAYWAWSW